MLEIFLVLVTVILLKLVYNNFRIIRNLPPGPFIYPFFGNLPQLVPLQHVTVHERVDKLVRKYGSLVFTRFGITDELIVQDLHLTKEILTSEDWTDRILYNEYHGSKYFGRDLGVLYASGNVWKEMRSFTTKTLGRLGFGKKQSMESTLDSEIEVMIKKLDSDFEAGRDSNLQHFFNIPIINMLWVMVAGVKFPHDDGNLRRIITLVDEYLETCAEEPWLIRAFPPIFKFYKGTDWNKMRMKFYRELHSLFALSLEERRVKYEDKNVSLDNPTDFIDAFFQKIMDEKEKKGSLFTEEQLIVILYELFMAGNDTTAKTLEFSMLYMAKYPGNQKKVQEELVKGSKGEIIELEQRQRFPYTEATLLEIQRLVSVLPFHTRACWRDTRIGGYFIPKGTIAYIPAANIHRSTAIWTDPEEFRPERFLSEEGELINTHKIIPFGGGRRVCLGEGPARAALFKIFTAIIQRYNLEERTEIVSTYGVTTAPKKCIVKFTKRK